MHENISFLKRKAVMTHRLIIAVKKWCVAKDMAVASKQWFY